MNKLLFPLLAGLTLAAVPTLSRAGGEGTSNMSKLTPEEEQLQQLWEDYFQSLRTNYAHLDKIDFELFLERILDSPRGQRSSGLPNYVPAFWACADCPCCPLSTKPDPVARLIQQLGADDFARREQATKELEAVGEPALEALKIAAAGSDDAEIRRRSEAIIQKIAGLITRKEIEKLQGTWTLVSYEMDGRQIKGEDKENVITFNGDRWSTSQGGTLFQGGTIGLIERLEKRNSIDLLIAEGHNAGATAYSIYAIEGDTLRYLNCGELRTREFTTRPGDGYHFLTFRRAKP